MTTGSSVRWVSISRNKGPIIQSPYLSAGARRPSFQCGAMSSSVLDYLGRRRRTLKFMTVSPICHCCRAILIRPLRIHLQGPQSSRILLERDVVVEILGGRRASALVFGLPFAQRHCWILDALIDHFLDPLGKLIVNAGIMSIRAVD